MSTMNKIREPKQERSIETKNKIINAGLEVFASVGYYGTNTAEIARVAGVSTGIVYGYFHDKRDILLCVLDIYIQKVTRPIVEIMEGLSAPVDIKDLSEKLVTEVIGIHEDNARLHNTLHALAATDEGVNSSFIALEREITEKISSRFIELGFDGSAMSEKVHSAMNLIQSFAHEYVFDKHDYIDYSVMRGLILTMVTQLFA